VAQAKFYLAHAGQDVAPIESAHQRYHAVLDGVRALVPRGVKNQIIERAFLPQFTFTEADLVITVGPDGLVVNAAKYLDGQPILAVNPDPAAIEGVLLPFAGHTLPHALRAVLFGQARTRRSPSTRA
jgi:NAD kinase